MTELELTKKYTIIVEALFNDNIIDCLMILSGVMGGILCPKIQLGMLSVDDANNIIDHHMKRVKAMFEFANQNKESNPEFGLNQ